jgi:hypothetical protein
MHREKSIAHHGHKIANSSSSDDENNVSLDANQEDAPEAHVSTHDAASSSAMS